MEHTMLSENEKSVLQKAWERSRNKLFPWVIAGASWMIQTLESLEYNRTRVAELEMELAELRAYPPILPSLLRLRETNDLEYRVALRVLDTPGWITGAEEPACPTPRVYAVYRKRGRDERGWVYEFAGMKI